MARLKKKKRKRNKRKINKDFVDDNKKSDNSIGYNINEEKYNDAVDSFPKSLFDMLHFNKKFISKEKLLKEQSFKNKFDRLKNRIFLNKNFNELLDFKKLNTNIIYYIDEYTDEVDILIQELIVIFKKRAAISQSISYKEYQLIKDCLENIKNLYIKYKQEGLSDYVKSGIDEIIAANKIMKYYIF